MILIFNRALHLKLVDFIGPNDKLMIYCGFCKWYLYHRTLRYGR